MGPMMLFWAVVLFLLVWFAIQAVRGQGRYDAGDGRRVGGGDPGEILRERYARGEIDRDTFLRMLEDIARGPTPKG